MRQKEIIKQQQDPNCLIERKEAKKKKKKKWTLGFHKRMMKELNILEKPKTRLAYVKESGVL